MCTSYVPETYVDVPKAPATVRAVVFRLLVSHPPGAWRSGTKCTVRHSHSTASAPAGGG